MLQTVVDGLVGSMGFYKGSGSPTFYTTLPVLTSLLVHRDNDGHRLWRTTAELASEMGVSSIVTVEVMEGETDLIGIIVNLKDYTIGADKGGDVNFFDDFDIDYNQYKYLLETRDFWCSDKDSVGSGYQEGGCGWYVGYAD